MALRPISVRGGLGILHKPPIASPESGRMLASAPHQGHPGNFCEESGWARMKTNGPACARCGDFAADSRCGAAVLGSTWPVLPRLARRRRSGPSRSTLRCAVLERTRVPCGGCRRRRSTRSRIVGARLPQPFTPLEEIAGTGKRAWRLNPAATSLDQALGR